MIVYLILIAICSFVLTALFRRYALAKNIVDIPNRRSSHKAPTPRGGGVSIVVSVLAALAVLKTAGTLPPSFFWALLGAGAWTALVGWFDDCGEVPAAARLAGHFIGTLWALFWLGGMPPLLVFGHTVDLGWSGHVAAVFYLVWMLNLYNFMDGIDGIAGIEVVTVCVGAVVLCFVSPGPDFLLVVPALLAAAAAGFLYWNFPRARIFMGDTGSGFLGIVIGVLAIQAGWAAPGLFWGWLILTGAFVVDATVTLVRRALGGEKVYRAHRSHAYQRAAIRVGSHWPVSLAYGAVNLFWLLPMAVLSVLWPGWGPALLAAAWAPMVFLCFRLKAGIPE